MNGKYKILPEPYTGPNFNTDLTFTYGYGALTAGHLDLTKSYKTFGTLGQGLAADQNTYDDSTTDLGALASWKGSGQQYMAITFIPVSDNTDTSKTAKAKVMGKRLPTLITDLTNEYYGIESNTDMTQECGCEELGVQFCSLSAPCIECPSSIIYCYDPSLWTSDSYKEGCKLWCFPDNGTLADIMDLQTYSSAWVFKVSIWISVAIALVSSV